jgi:hypothetical protein
MTEERKEGMQGKLWVADSGNTWTALEEEQDRAMREAYLQALTMLARHVYEGKPLLRVVEFSVHKEETEDHARVRMVGFESDEDYDFYTRKKREEEKGRGYAV